MGSVSMLQTTAGIHFRLRARTFVLANGSGGRPTFAFVNLGARMRTWRSAPSETHTHARPSGHLQYVMYSVTSLGFIDAAIEQSLVQAHGNLKPGSIFINRGEFF